MTREKLDECWTRCQLMRLIQDSNHTDDEKRRMVAVVRIGSPLHRDETFYQAVAAEEEFDAIDFNEVAREMERRGEA